MRNCWTKVISAALAALMAVLPVGIAVFADEAPDILIRTTADMQVLTAGEATDLKIPIENLTHASLSSMVIAPVIDDLSKFPFEITSIGALSTRATLEPKERKVIYMPVKVLKTAENKVYTMNLSFNYKTSDGLSGTITKPIYFRVSNGLGQPQLEIRKVQVADGYIPAGESRDVSFELYNNSTMNLTDFKVSFKDLSTGGLYPASYEKTATLTALAPQKGFPFTFDLKADGSLETKSYVHTLEITFQDEYGKQYTQEKKVYIPVRKSSDQVLDLALENVKVPAGIKTGADFTVAFSLANRSQSTLQNVTAKLEADAGILAKSAPIQQAKQVGPGASHPFQFKLSAKSDLESKSYPVKVVITYTVGSGTAESTYYEYINLDLAGGAGKTTPKVIVSNYSYGDGPVLANQAFPLKLTFANTNQSKPIYNAKITLVSAENVFTPVDASNAFFINSIGAVGSVSRQVMLMADYAAKPKNYPVEIKIDYEDAEGKTLSQSDTVSIPVMQELIPRISKVEIPPVANLNMPTQMSLTVFNIGKAEIRNMFVTISGDNLISEQGETYLGNLGEGSDTYFDGSFTPTALGEQKGVVRITYQDGAGKEFELNHEFTVTVEEMPPMEPGMDGMPPMENPADKWLKWIKIGAGVLLAVVAGVAGFRFYKGRKSRKQADKL